MIALGLGCVAPPHRPAPAIGSPHAPAVRLADTATPVASAAAVQAPVTPGPLGELAYVQDGALWVKALPDGPAQQLSAQVTGPLRWSPSGAWLLAGGIVFAADGSSQRSAAGCVAWSPVADELACVERGQGLAIESADGSQQQLISAPDISDPSAPPIWSHDGSRLAYAVSGPVATSREPYSSPSGLWTVNADGSDAQQLFTNEVYSADGGLIEPVAWSPDGATIVFQLDPFQSSSIAMDGLELYAISSSGGTPVDLHTVSLVSPVYPGFVGGFSPADAQTLAVAAGEDRETWTNKRLALVDVTSGTRTDLTGTDTAVLAPVWSPDGRQIAYVSAPDERPVPGGDAAKALMAQRHLWLVNADGSDQRQLTDDPAYRDERPLWSADGTQILFARIDNAGDAASLWLLPLSGGAPAKVADISLQSGDSQADPLWFSTYGAVAWDSLFAWWEPPAASGS